MPSANPKLEKQASTEATDPIRQAITVIDHKIRNLEKRKSKLESYRDIQKTGKELNHDQKIAVAKYDEVLQTLEITRELSKQIIGIANDSAKQQKKIARKEALERMQQDISKVREVLLIQDVLMNMGGDSVREDFLSGSNGASKLTKEDIKYLDDLFNEVTLKRQPEKDELPFLQQAQKAAEHFIAIVEGKQREVFGTTYVKIKEIIASVNQSGYFDQTSEVETEVSGVVKTDEPVKIDNDSAEKTSENFTGDVHIPAPESMIPITSYPVQVAPVAVVPGSAPVTIPVVAPQVIPPHATAPIETTYYANAAGFVPPQQNQPPQNQQPPRINDVIGGTPNFFFLQESEIDSPEVSTQQQIAAHIPAVNPPIPTQTYTNPSFTGAPVQVPQQVIYTHPPQDMSHIPGFANPNPPPPIPMPPSHQQQSMQFSPQHQTSFPAQQGQMQQGFEQKDGQTQSTEEKVEHHKKNPVSAITDAKCPNSNDWSQMTDSNQIEDWSAGDAQQSPAHNDQGQSQQQSWGEQRSGYRGRGGRRGNSNGYNSRGRGGGGYQQNGRGGSGQASYYRNENSNYQNGYQPRNYNNDGNAGYNGGFKRGGGVGGPRGGSRGGGGERGERTGMDRGGRGGQFRGQRGGNRGGGGYIPRGKPQTQQ